MCTFWKITLGEYRALHEKGAPRAIQTMCVLTIKNDRFCLYVPSLGLSFWGTMRSGIGPNQNALHQFCGRTHCAFLSALPLSSIGSSNRVIARTAFAMGFSRQMRPQSSNLCRVIPMPTLTNFGCFSELCMVYRGRPDIGTTRSRESWLVCLELTVPSNKTGCR